MRQGQALHNPSLSKGVFMKALFSVLTLVLTFSAASQAQTVLTKQDLLTNSPATHQKVIGLKDFRVVIPGVL